MATADQSLRLPSPTRMGTCSTSPRPVPSRPKPQHQSEPSARTPQVAPLVAAIEVHVQASEPTCTGAYRESAVPSPSPP